MAVGLTWGDLYAVHRWTAQHRPVPQLCCSLLSPSLVPAALHALCQTWVTHHCSTWQQLPRSLLVKYQHSLQQSLWCNLTASVHTPWPDISPSGPCGCTSHRLKVTRICCRGLIPREWSPQRKKSSGTWKGAWTFPETKPIAAAWSSSAHLFCAFHYAWSSVIFSPMLHQQLWWAHSDQAMLVFHL